jgi:hypothetical protein
VSTDSSHYKASEVLQRKNTQKTQSFAIIAIASDGADTD